MPVTATNGAISRTFTCEQWALMNQSGWVVVSSNCGGTAQNAPYAHSGTGISGVANPYTNQVGGVTSGTAHTLTIPARRAIKTVLVIPSANTSSAMCGFSSGGSEVFSESLTNNLQFSVDFFRWCSVDTQLYFTGIPSGSEVIVFIL